MKRLGIFLFFDTEGIADRYIEYLLNSFDGILDKLVTTVNGDVDARSRELLECFGSAIYFRENIGFDAMAYKETLLEYLGADEVRSYDELVIFNDTFYGPLTSWRSVWRSMSHKECDIWGLTAHESTGLGLENNKHLQSFFLVIKNKVLNGSAFWNFWDGIGIYDNYEELVKNFERSFSQRMIDAGYVLRAYCEAEEFKTENLESNYNYFLHNASELIIRHKLPILKKKSFFVAGLEPLNADLNKALSYIADHTDYDVSKIYENLLRTSRYYDLVHNLGLHFVIDPEHIDGDASPALEKSCVFVISDNDSQIEFYKRYCRTHKISIPVIGVKDVFSIRDHVGKYDYFCILDQREVDQPDGFRQNVINGYTLADNLLLSNEYIAEIRRLLSSDNIKVGAVSRSLMTERDFCQIIDERYQPDIEPGIPVIRYDSSFWCRSEVYALLIENALWGDESEEIRYRAEILRPLILQKHGYYSITVENLNYTSKCVGYITRPPQVIIQTVPGSPPANYQRDSMIRANIMLFMKYMIEPESDTYIYGAGQIGALCHQYAEEAGLKVTGHIISDSEDPTKFSDISPIFLLSEYVPSDSDTIIIGVGKQYSQEIYDSLKDLQVRNILQLVY